MSKELYLAKKLPDGRFEILAGPYDPYQTDKKPSYVREGDCLEASEWVGKGSVKILRSALPVDHPESWQSLWIAKFGSMAGFPYKQLGWDKPPQVCPHCGKEIKE